MSPAPTAAAAAAAINVDLVSAARRRHAKSILHACRRRRVLAASFRVFRRPAPAHWRCAESEMWSLKIPLIPPHRCIRLHRSYS